jgi:acetyl esterase/lipase
MKPSYFAVLVFVALAGCERAGKPAPQPVLPGSGTGSQDNAASLVEARKGFQSKLVRRKEDKEPVDEPPPKVFRKVQYESPAGKLAAYLIPDPKDGKKHPAIIWITGGDCNSIGDVWTEQKPSDDQTASAYRKAGLVMMFPSLRGGNDNPGQKEGFLGEVDDILAAADFLAKQEYVDPALIYLGGHSTGGTLVLLVAECSGRFRAVFSFGPVEDVAGYGPEYLPFDFRNKREVELRSPGRWLAAIKSPVFVFEGTRQGNLDSLQAMSRTSKNPNVHFLPVRGATHFSLLAPTNRLIAAKIVRDAGPTSNLTFTEDEVNQAVKK